MLQKGICTILIIYFNEKEKGALYKDYISLS